MDWQEFLRKEASEHGLSAEQTVALLAALPNPDRQKSLDEIAAILKLEIVTIKSESRLGGVYKNFEDTCPQLKTNVRGKLENIRQYLTKKYYGKPIKAPANFSPYPEEFKSLIQEKIRRFCGRQFVLDTFEKFLKDNPSGYFTVVGDAGMGKSAIAAKYVDKYKSPCYFNVLAEGRNSPELFLQSIRQQLINRYALKEAQEDNLPILLAKISQNLPAGERLVIVVDALDEVNQEPGGNLLYLPMTLPERVYFLLTRRPYNLETKRLSVTQGVAMKELDLRAEDYVNFSREDVKEYIRLFLYEDPEYKDGLKKWIQERHISDDYFVEQVADKSENNFMYLCYVLPTIAKGEYDDLSLKQLPQGLLDYYQNHWVRMGMETAPKKKMVIILFILKEIGKPIPCQMIADIADIEEYEVQKTLDEWVEYLKQQKIDGDVCYSIYHASFLDFLEKKKELDKNRKLFKDVNQGIVEYWEREMEGDEGEDEDEKEDC